MTTFDLDASRNYCRVIGLKWLGDEFVTSAMQEAYMLDFTQEQFNAAMRHHLWQVKYLFTPRNYNFFGRLKLVMYFLFGFKMGN